MESGRAFLLADTWALLLFLQRFILARSLMALQHIIQYIEAISWSIYHIGAHNFIISYEKN